MDAEPADSKTQRRTQKTKGDVYVQFHGSQFVILLTWPSTELAHKHLKVATCKHFYYGFDIIHIRATRKTT